MGAEMRYFSLAGFLFAFWVALSGHYTPMLVAAGVASYANSITLTPGMITVGSKFFRHGDLAYDVNRESLA